MPIKWSALEVSEAMDRIDGLLDQAEPFLREAREVAVEATQIHSLPQYMHERLTRLESTLRGSQSVPRRDVESVRKLIPQDALMAERESRKQRSLL